MEERVAANCGTLTPQIMAGSPEVRPPHALMTPDQNMKKHINSPNLMIPNKIGKPLSWYNELDAAGDDPLNSGNIFADEEEEKRESEIEPDMTGVEENVETKADLMHEGRGRVRTSSQVFAKKELAARR